MTLEPAAHDRVRHAVRGDARRACACRRRRGSAARGSGWATWHETMLDGIVMLAAQAVGGARYALDITVQYAKDREQFDKPLGAFQAIAHYLADAVDRGRRRRDARVRSGVGARERPADRAARADGEAVRVQDVPRRHRDGAAGLRRRRLHGRSTTSSSTSGGPSSCRSRGGTTARSRSSSRRPCSIDAASDGFLCNKIGCDETTRGSGRRDRGFADVAGRGLLVVVSPRQPDHDPDLDRHGVDRGAGHYRRRLGDRPPPARR